MWWWGILLRGRLILAVAAMCAVSLSCSEINRINVTKFRPISSDSEYAYYVYEAFADATYPEDSASAENTRSNGLKNISPTTEWQAITMKFKAERQSTRVLACLVKFTIFTMRCELKIDGMNYPLP